MDIENGSRPMSLIGSDNIVITDYDVFPSGLVFDKIENHLIKPYESTNGHRYILLRSTNKVGFELVLLEDIIASTFLEIPKQLTNKTLIVMQKNKSDDWSVGNLYYDEFVEEWKPIILDDEPTDYEVSNIGNIASNKYGKRRIMKPQKGCHDTRKVMLRINGEYTSPVAIHRLVAMNFVPNMSTERCCVNHIDGRPFNNHFLNLEWVTYSENSKHAVMSGLHTNFKHGIENVSNRYTEDQIRLVCELLEKRSSSIFDIAKKTNTSYRLVCSILYEGRWEHISSQYNIKHKILES